MQAKDAIEQLVEFCHMLTHMYVDDLDDSQLLVRSVPGTNHIAWQLGHLIVGTKHMLTGLGHATPEVPEAWNKIYSKEMSGSDDPGIFATKAEYLARLDAMKAACIEAIRNTPDGTLDAPGPESMREYAPTHASALMLLGTHVLMHAGQFVPIRRKLGKPAAF